MNDQLKDTGGGGSDTQVNILMDGFINHLADLVRAWPEGACAASVHIVGIHGSPFKEDAPPDFILWENRNPGIPEPFVVLSASAAIDLLSGKEIQLTGTACNKNLRAFGDRVVEVLRSCREGAYIVINPSNGFMPWATFYQPNFMSIGATEQPSERPGITYQITWTDLPTPVDPT